MAPTAHRSPRARLAATAGWLALVAAIELTARVVVYALSPLPDTASAGLAARLGGPRLVVVALVSVGLALALAATVVWLASLAVRERRALARRPAGPAAPAVSVRAVAVRSIALTAAAAGAFAAVESYLHWRAGLGWHGPSCLLGPVHRDALPVIVALAIVSAAAVTAAGHLARWMRATIERLRGVAPAGRRAPAPRRGVAAAACAPRPVTRLLRPRGPPLLVA